ncbi:response regulator [Candidatus Electronema sp. TJ]|uniref:hybrid sensor histidine kinase/response regulator n=1 Tax=Candidatus Electronema sp. TJ TaxID=3401573 RepID=UPI003AA84DA5
MKDIILIVDDQPASLKVLLSLLEDQDFELRIFQSGAQALAGLAHFTPDVILLDVLMPEMNGFETCRRIKARPELADIPVIFMTALASVEDKIEGFAVGGVDYITKPFQQAEVLARISTQLKLRRKTLKLKAAQETLRHQKIMLEALLDSIPDLIYFKDTANRYLGCNQAFEIFFGKKVQDILGQADEAVLPAAAAESFRSRDQALLAACASERSEEELSGIDGAAALYDILKSPYIGPDGSPLGLIGICRNITELKQAERRAEEERERLSVTLHSIGDGVIATDVVGNVVYCNQVAERLTGWNSIEAAGRPSAEVFRLTTEEGDGQHCPSPAGQGLDKCSVLIRKDGRRLSVADSCAPIRDREGRIIGTVIVFRDVTGERKMIEEMIKVKKLESVGLLAAGIAHDFNNILTAILGNIELASFRLRTEDSETASLLADADKAARRAAKLTRQLLIFAKGGEPVREATALAELVRESADFILHGSPVFCDYDFPDDLWLIEADSGQISQVVQNIILNAKQAMSAGGRIHIRCANVEGEKEDALPPGLRQGRFVRINIQDSGGGIPPEIMEKIFDPYFTTKPDGNGLGLAICHVVVKKHEGWIAAQSEPGCGTVFSVYLPAARTGSPAAAQVPRHETETAKKSPLLIMVMDDDEMLRNLAKIQLLSLGHEAVLAADGMEAVCLCRKLREDGRPVDLVIMDLTIPGGMGGKEAAILLLAEDPKARLIVASGYSNDPVLADYRSYGFRAAVAKPFSRKELSRAIAAAL